MLLWTVMLGAGGYGPAALSAPAAQRLPPRVEFRLAQRQPGLGLVELTLPQRERLYYLDTPVLARADLQSVTAMRASTGQAFVRLQFTVAGRSRLATVTGQNIGRTLLFTIDGQLIGAPRITRAVADGVLDLTMDSEALALAVSGAVLGAPVTVPGPRPQPPQ